MASRLLARLDAEIDAEKDPLRKDCLRADRAGALARHGHVGQARRIVNELRTRSRRSEHPELAAWLSLTEGMIDHFDSMAPNARQRFLRAHAIARAAQLKPLQALSAAWLATAEFNASAWAAMIQLVAEALSLAEPDHHAARARACLLMADAHSRADQDKLATPWFRSARDHATADGDTSMISVLLFNRTAVRVSEASMMEAIGRPDPNRIRQALLETESTGNFDAGLGLASLQDMVPVVRAQILVSAGRFAEALALLHTHAAAAAQQGFWSMAPRFKADSGFCHARLGDLPAARAALDEAVAALHPDIHFDDRACVFARDAAVRRLEGNAAGADAVQAQAEEALASYRAAQADIATQLANSAALRVP